MALFGLLSLAQIILLPGYLLLRSLRLGLGILATCVLSFALSLALNHVLVLALVVAGIYRPPVVYVIFATELLALLAIDHRRLQKGFAAALVVWWRRVRGFYFGLDRLPLTCAARNSPVAFPAPAAQFHALRRILLAAAALVIGGFAVCGLAAVGQIFQQWDAVVSWNRWAIDWAANQLPRATGLYPQLLPANLSLSYVFQGSSEIWIFAKAYQFLFCLMMLLAMLDLARVEGRFGYVPGVVITYLLLVALLRFRMLSSGYADVPLAFFTLAAVYALALARNIASVHKPPALARNTDPEARNKLLIVGALLAAGAALTKQTGLYIAATYPILAWRFVLRRQPVGARSYLPLLLCMCAMMAILVLPWYIAKLFDFGAGCDRNNTIELLTDFHEGRSVLERLVYAGNLLADAITPTGCALLLAAVAASLRDPLLRWLLGIVVVPLGLIWAVAFSYDVRNVAVIVPWVGAAAGVGMMQIVSSASILGRTICRRIDFQIRPVAEGRTRRSILRALVQWRPGSGIAPFLRVWHVAGLCAAVLAAACLCISDRALLDFQRRQQRSIGVAELNQQLYAYAAEHPSDAKIATDYCAMPWLPELGPRSVVCASREFAGFQQAFDQADVRYLLLRTAGAAPEVREFLQGQTAARLIFTNHGFAFYDKRPDSQTNVAAVR